MANEKRISESRVTYETLITDLSKPVIVERDGKPFGVFVAFEEYERLKTAAEENAQRREQAWQQLDTLLANVHTRTTELDPEEIEAEVTAAVQDVKAERRARRSRR